MPPAIEPLGQQHDRAAFACGAAPLDRYLQQQAGQDLRNKVSAVFVLCLPGSTAVLGYYTLSASVIAPSDLEPVLQKRLPRYAALPAVLLGRLAVDQRQQGRGYGKVLLIDALQRSLRIQSQVGAVAVTVDAKDDAARSFYERYGFTRFVHHEYQLYLPMKTVEQLFPAGEA
jgi:GNAT superfamily N-acetyltransferase